MKNIVKLGVNIDHVATLRQQRLEDEPNLCEAAKVALDNGADSITVHLREDRRHIQDQDIHDLRPIVPYLNFELSTARDVIDLALNIQPEAYCLVPEKREELTTEGGLNVLKYANQLTPIINEMSSTGGNVSLFIDPDLHQIDKAKEIGASHIELHTGTYAIKTKEEQEKELLLIKKAAQHAFSIGLIVHAGHGLKYYNVSAIAQLPEIVELNIGHSIISNALYMGLGPAVSKMKTLINTRIEV